MRGALVVLFFLAVAGGALAQKKSVPPPPKPQDEGPSLEATMKFIEDKLSAQGTIIYASYVHDAETGEDWVVKFSNQMTNIVASVPKCQISFHFYAAADGEVVIDSDVRIKLTTVQNVVVMTREQAFKNFDTNAGHPTWSTKVDPPVWVLQAQRKDGVNDFSFRDEDMANRVAKAMVHAIELCGGGQEKEPF